MRPSVDFGGHFYFKIMRNEVKDLCKPTTFGVGYLGYGRYKSRDKSGGEDRTKVYRTWKGMLERCYSEKYLSKKPTYKGCSVDEDWHNFQNFASWFYEKYNSDYMQN